VRTTPDRHVCKMSRVISQDVAVPYGRERDDLWRHTERQPGIQPTNHWLMPRPTCGAADVSSRAAAAALVDATSCS